MNLDTPNLIPLKDVSKWLPLKPKYPILRRWCVVGIDGMYMDYMRLGGRLFTTLEAAQRFSKSLEDLGLLSPNKKPKEKGEPKKKARKEVPPKINYRANSHQNQYTRNKKSNRECNCDYCGKLFTKWSIGDSSTNKFCSRKCSGLSRVVTPEHKAEMRRAYNARYRAKRKKLKTEKFTHEEVFQRDGYKCQHCGVKTRRVKDTTDPRYPNLDHIVPISKGGQHTKKNTQCLCHQCNLKKHTNGEGLDQLRLFG